MVIKGERIGHLLRPKPKFILDRSFDSDSLSLGDQIQFFAILEVNRIFLEPDMDGDDRFKAQMLIPKIEKIDKKNNEISTMTMRTKPSIEIDETILPGLPSKRDGEKIRGVLDCKLIERTKNYIVLMVNYITELDKIRMN